MADALQDAGLLGFFLLAQQAHGGVMASSGEAKRPLRTLTWTNCSRSAGKWVFIWAVSFGIQLTTAGGVCRGVRLDVCVHMDGCAYPDRCR